MPSHILARPLVHPTRSASSFALDTQRACMDLVARNLNLFLHRRVLRSKSQVQECMHVVLQTCRPHRRPSEDYQYTAVYARSP